MKKLLALVLGIAFGMGTIGCDDKPKPPTEPPKTNVSDKEKDKSKPGEKATEKK